MSLENNYLLEPNEQFIHFEEMSQKYHQESEGKGFYNWMLDINQGTQWL